MGETSNKRTGYDLIIYFWIGVVFVGLFFSDTKNLSTFYLIYSLFILACLAIVFSGKYKDKSKLAYVLFQISRPKKETPAGKAIHLIKGILVFCFGLILFLYVIDGHYELQLAPIEFIKHILSEYRYSA